RPGADVPDETRDPNWAHVRDAGARPPGEIRWVGADGALAFLAAVPLTDADKDAATTQAVREALIAGDSDKAEQRIAAAQGPDPPRGDADRPDHGRCPDHDPNPRGVRRRRRHHGRLSHQPGRGVHAGDGGRRGRDTGRRPQVTVVPVNGGWVMREMMKHLWSS